MSTTASVMDRSYRPTDWALAALVAIGVLLLAGRWWFLDWRTQPAEWQRSHTIARESSPLADSRDQPRLPVEAFLTVDSSNDEPLRLERKPVYEKKPQPNGLVDINQAPLSDLQTLPGIGPVLAQRIEDARRDAPFRRIEDLRRVSGIGVKRLDALRPFIIVSNR